MTARSSALCFGAHAVGSGGYVSSGSEVRLGPVQEVFVGGGAQHGQSLR